jgi:hypothetical protein
MARRDGTFPDLLDQVNKIHRLTRFDDLNDAITSLANQYTLDRTEGQDYNIYIGIEKRAMLPQLEAWFKKYGVPIITFGGFASQTYVDNIIRDVYDDERETVFIYGGDLDPSGDLIPEDFLDRAECFNTYIKIAVTPEQVKKYNLVPAPFTKRDPRNNGFKAKYGGLYQVEIEAIDPPILRGLYESVFFNYFDVSRCEQVLNRERDDRAELAALADNINDGGAHYD